MTGDTPRVEARHVARAEAADACSVPPVGTPITRLSDAQLLWAESEGVLGDDDRAALAALAGRIAPGHLGRPPVWAFAGHGHGHGDGDGYGSGEEEEDDA